MRQQEHFSLLPRCHYHMLIYKSVWLLHLLKGHWMSQILVTSWGMGHLYLGLTIYGIYCSKNLTCFCGRVVSKIHSSTLILTCLWTSKRVLTKSLGMGKVHSQLSVSKHFHRVYREIKLTMYLQIPFAKWHQWPFSLSMQ